MCEYLQVVIKLSCWFDKFSPPAQISNQKHWSKPQYSIGGFGWIFINLLKVHHSHSRYQKATSNLLRINLKGKLRFSDERPQEGAMYINLWQNIRGHHKIYFVANISKYWRFQTKQFTRLVELIKLYKNPLENLFISLFFFTNTIVWFNITLHWENTQCDKNLINWWQAKKINWAVTLRCWADPRHLNRPLTMMARRPHSTSHSSMLWEVRMTDLWPSLTMESRQSHRKRREWGSIPVVGSSWVLRRMQSLNERCGLW